MTKPMDAMDGGVMLVREPALPWSISLIGYKRHTEDTSGNVCSDENKAAANSKQ